MQRNPSKRRSAAEKLDVFFDSLPEVAGGLLCTPWVKHRVEERMNRAARKLANRLGVKDDADIYALLDDEVATPCFFAGFDFCLAWQEALKACAGGNPEALRPFIPTPHNQTKRRRP